jgi:hypothetical protein
MPINKNLSDLPAAETREGVTPDADPFIGRAIAEAWLSENFSDEKAHAVEGTSFRFSMAGACSRELAYYMTDTPISDPVDAAGAWRMSLGTMVHEAVQKYQNYIIPALMLDVDETRSGSIDDEVKTHIDRCNGSGHADMVITVLDGNNTVLKKTVVELKTINGFGYKMAATSFKGAPEGPRQDHVLQAALNAYALDADEVIVCYLSMENVSPNLIKYCDDPMFGRFTAQWTYSKAEWMPLAEAEIERVSKIQARLNEVDGDALQIRRRVKNDDGVWVTVNDPSTGAWTRTDEDGAIVDAGKYWKCAYCNYQQQCVGDM